METLWTQDVGAPLKWVIDGRLSCYDGGDYAGAVVVVSDIAEAVRRSLRCIICGYK